MKEFKDRFIIGIDHGYGNIKTANHVFKTGVAASDTEPVFGTNVLLYNDRYYLIGEGHKEFNADKITDEEYFILTLAGIAMELNSYGLTEANVHIAAGLPLKWVSQQKKAFSDYLLRVPDVRFAFNRKNYRVRITGVNIFPQGFAAIQDNGILTQMMNEGYAHSTVKHVYGLLKEYFRYLCCEEHIPKNPMAYVRMIRKANFLAAQGKENIAQSVAVTVLSDEEIQCMREEVFAKNKKGALKHHQAVAYLLMLNTGLRTGEALGLINSDIDLDDKELRVTRAVKEVSKRDKDGTVCGTELIVGGMKTAASKRTIPLNSTAIEMILILRTERYFGADSPLISNQVGDFTRPSTFRSRWYTLLDFAGISHKGLHSLRHTFATRLINGVEDENGNLKTLTVRQVADLFGHTTSSVTEKYYVRREPNKLCGITDEFEL